MKSHTIEWTPFHSQDSRAVLTAPAPLREPLRAPLYGALGLAARVSTALAAALVLVVGAAWLVTLPHLVVYLQALTWVGGFVFLALAVEAESPHAALLHLATGLALPVLAWLSSRLAVELAIVAATIVAIWVAAAFLRR